MHLYQGTTQQFIGDATQARLANQLSERFFAEFRYRPWDVPLGVALMFVGLAAAGFCLVRREPQGAQAEERSVIDLVQPVRVGESAMTD